MAYAGIVGGIKGGSVRSCGIGSSGRASAKRDLRKAAGKVPDVVAPTGDRACQGGGVILVDEPAAAGEPRRRGFRAAHPFDGYAKRGSLTDRQLAAGYGFRDVCGLAGLEPAAARAMDGTSRGVAAFPADGMTVARLDAIRKLASARALLGAPLFVVLYAVAHEGIEAGQAPGVVGSDPRERSRAGMILLRAALDALVGA